jgi:hypothetical protein
MSRDNTKQNYLTYSEAFDNAVWTKAQVTISPDAVVAPDGTTTADKVVETAVTNVHGITRQLLSTAVPPMGTWTWSVFVKAGERSACRLEMSGVNTYATLDVDLTTGTVVAAGTYAMQLDGGLDRTYQPDGSWIGWYRLWVTQSAAPAGSYVVLYMQAAPGGSTSYLGDITKGLYLWGGQLVFANWQGIYTPTTDTAWRLVIGSLSEPRQNYLQYSDQFDNAIWTKNTGVSVSADTLDVTDPLGGNTAGKLVYDGSGILNDYRLAQTSVLRTRQGFAASLYIRTLSGGRAMRIGNNVTATDIVVTDRWQRFSSIAPDAAPAAVFMQCMLYNQTGNNTGWTLYLWGGQLNVANYAPVYCRTTLYPMKRAIRSAT